MPKKKFTDFQERMVVADYLGGLTIQRLAEKYRCSVGNIYNILDQYGVNRRGRGKDRSPRMKKNSRNVRRGGLTI